MAHRGDGGHPLRDQAGERCGVLRIEVGAVQRPAGPHPGVVLVEIGAEVQAFLEVGDASGELAADGEPPPPRPTGVGHRDGRLGLIGQGEELPGGVLERGAQRGVDAVAHDLEHAGLLSGLGELGPDAGGRRVPSAQRGPGSGVDERGDVEHRHLSDRLGPWPGGRSRRRIPERRVDHGAGWHRAPTWGERAGRTARSTDLNHLRNGLTVWPAAPQTCQIAPPVAVRGVGRAR